MEIQTSPLLYVVLLFVFLLIVSNWWTARLISKANGAEAAKLVHDNACAIIKAQGQYLEDITSFHRSQRDPAKLAQWIAKTAMELAGRPVALIDEPPAPVNGEEEREPMFTASDRI